MTCVRNHIHETLKWLQERWGASSVKLMLFFQSGENDLRSEERQGIVFVGMCEKAVMTIIHTKQSAIPLQQTPSALSSQVSPATQLAPRRLSHQWPHQAISHNIENTIHFFPPPIMDNFGILFACPDSEALKRTQLVTVHETPCFVVTGLQRVRQLCSGLGCSSEFEQEGNNMVINSFKQNKSKQMFNLPEWVNVCYHTCILVLSFLLRKINFWRTKVTRKDNYLMTER